MRTAARSEPDPCRRRACIRLSGSVPGSRKIDAVRKAPSGPRAIETSGRTASAGGSEDQSGSDPPRWEKANPVAQTGPAPGGSSLGLLRLPVVGCTGAPLRQVREAILSPADHRPWLHRFRRWRSRDPAAPSRTSGPRPASTPRRAPPGPRRGRSRPSPRRGESADDRDPPGIGRPRDRPAASRWIPPRLAIRGRLRRPAWRGRSRPRPCAPSRSGRAGGSSARRPRSCRRCRSPRWSASAGRRRRSWRGRSRRTA